MRIEEGSIWRQTDRLADRLVKVVNPVGDGALIVRCREWKEDGGGYCIGPVFGALRTRFELGAYVFVRAPRPGPEVPPAKKTSNPPDVPA